MTYDEIKAAWNDQADDGNRWHSLSEAEKVEWAAIHAVAKERAPMCAPAAPKGWKLVPVELLERIQESLGSFVSDHEWGQADMDAFDDLSALAAAPQPSKAEDKPPLVQIEWRDDGSDWAFDCAASLNVVTADLIKALKLIANADNSALDLAYCKGIARAAIANALREQATEARKVTEKMKFPNIEVQPHWLATLERAAKVMPHVRWVCLALDNDVEPRIEEEVRTAITKAIAPALSVITWYSCETGSDLQENQEYRKAWLNHMVEQCQAMQQEVHEEEVEVEEDDSEYDCPHCGGTGEGQYDGQTCSVCRGKGVCPK